MDAIVAQIVEWFKIYPIGMTYFVVAILILCIASAIGVGGGNE